ncbi:MAG: CRISPR-associated helicase Cas3' [Thermodesulfobacteriota bacterium]|nr:CRISPR-associated helicase Cas3' [Thermodesulfobacteriota bacterium]
MKDHLMSVGDLVRSFAGQWPFAEEAVLAGLLHDLGKYADLFQARLRGEASGLDHWSPGAWVALRDYRCVAAALAVQGHHVGLQQGSLQALRNLEPAVLSQRHPQKLKLSDADVARLTTRLAGDRMIISKPENCIIDTQEIFKNPVASMLNVRMLFSCLTDADFLDTEAHFEGDEQGKIYRESSPVLDAMEALQALEHFMTVEVHRKNEADRCVREARNALWETVTVAADNKPGLFTLTAPTGSGKTLAMLKFALEHAARNKSMKRIILAVPFLSIIEQTANIYRDVFKEFPDNYVLEHHSLAGLGSEKAKTDAEAASERSRRLLAENWDAPIIITTNVQLLESLFSNRPSACRKLHNLMESVIMFDEAQTLPQSLAVHTLAALSHLSQAYGTTILFATATQPAFDALDGAVTKLVNVGWRPVEAAPEHARLYDALRRYKVKWPKREETSDWATLSEEIRNEEQVLCVVNLKSHAAALLEELKNDDAVFHLSTNLCALHRREVLDEVRTRLKKGQVCRLISTQCVEAGVDIDFPVVYRALAPLDAIAQAAGRCNREGRLADADGKKMMGHVRVFEPTVEGDYRKRYPTRAYFQAAEVTRSMLTLTGVAGLDLNDPAVFRDYYHRLYDLSKPETQSKELGNAVIAVDFVRVAKEYRLIDQSAIQVLVPYGKCIDRFNELRSQQDKEGINSQWIRQAQGLAVSVYRPLNNHPNLIPAKLRYGKGTSDEWFIFQETEDGKYDDIKGLILPKTLQIYIA